MGDFFPDDRGDESAGRVFSLVVPSWESVFLGEEDLEKKLERTIEVTMCG